MSYNKIVQIDGKVVDKSHQNKIKSLIKGSPAQRGGLLPGDIVKKINGRNLKDIIDYKFLTSEEVVKLEVERPVLRDGREILEYKEFIIEKDTYEDLGIEFMSGLIDKAYSCSNNCIFCFIDQLPKGMRESLYFKDDDSRLSFLQGNFVTLTNLTDKDLDRIIEYRISPINISVHTTNGPLRDRILNNRNGHKILDRMRKLAKGKIRMNAQIVLMPDINDGEELIRTLKDLSELYPYVEGVAIVPLGLTKHREGLPKLKAFDEKSALETINLVEKLGKEYKEKFGTNFARCADEFYCLAKVDVPSGEYYEGYGQIEDGIGMIRLFREATEDSLDDLNNKAGSFTFVTGTSAYREIEDFTNRLKDKNKAIKVNSYMVKNNFFGESITVAGLITGRDLIEELKKGTVYENLIMPRNMFRAGEDIMLDDIRISDIERDLNTRVLVVDYTGEDLIEKINGRLKG